MGIDVDDPDAYYLYEARMATLWPFDADGMARGEDTYTGSDGFAGIADRKLAPTTSSSTRRPADRDALPLHLRRATVSGQ